MANYISGKAASISIQGVTMAFRKWKLSMKADALDVTNLTSGGYREVIDGIISGSLSMEAPYDQGNMPLDVGTTYTVVLTYTTGITLTVSALITEIAPDIDVKREEVISVSAEVTGTFTATIT